MQDLVSTESVLNTVEREIVSNLWKLSSPWHIFAMCQKTKLMGNKNGPNKTAQNKYSLICSDLVPSRSPCKNQ